MRSTNVLMWQNGSDKDYILCGRNIALAFFCEREGHTIFINDFKKVEPQRWKMQEM